MNKYFIFYFLLKDEYFQGCIGEVYPVIDRWNYLRDKT